jgi:hypothetical protein
VRTKAFFMSTSLAAGVWLTGCQNPATNKSSCQSCTTPSTVKSATESKDSLLADMHRGAGEKGDKARVTSLPAKSTTSALSTSAGKSASASPPPYVAAKAPVTMDSNTVAARTGSVVGREPSVFVLPGAGSAKAAAPAVAPAPIPAPPAPQTAATTVPPPVIIDAPSTAPATAAPTAPAPMASAVPGAVPHVAAETPAPPTPNQAAAGNYGPGVDVLINQAPAPVPVELVAQKKAPVVQPGSASEYQSVVGHVFQFRRAWKIRFATLETDDKYGGSFTLVGDNLDHLKDGQMVRVEGVVIPSDDRTGTARYQVNRIEILEPDAK